MNKHDTLKKMLEDIIAGKDEEAQVGFHSFFQSKMKSVLEGDDEDDESKDEDSDDDEDSDEKKKSKKSKDDDKDSDDEKDSDDDDGKPPWLKKKKVEEGEALGSRDKRVKSKVNSFVSRNKAKDSAPGGLKKTSTKKSRDLDVSSTTDKSENL